MMVNGIVSGLKNRTNALSIAGFALPAVILTLVVMSVLTVAALTTAGYEYRSARAINESGAAFFAAEAGINEIWASLQDSAVAGLAPGDSLDLGWRTLDNGARYHALIYRLDNGGQKMFQLAVEGRGAGPFGGSRRLSLALTSEGASKLGRCCDAAAIVDGWVNMQHVGTQVDGHDQTPAAWSGSGACADTTPTDKPGIVMKDTTLFSIDTNAQLDGEPKLDQEATIDENTFSQFGPDLTWDELRQMADHTLGQWGTAEQEFTPQPSYNADGTCNTADPLNWGSNDPADPCFDYFPIVLLKGDISFHNSYGQALIILDWNQTSMLGTELDLEDAFSFNGIILGKGCIEIQGSSVMHGALFADGNYFNSSICGGDAVLELNADAEGGGGPGKLFFSQCVIERTLTNTGLDLYTSPTDLKILGLRAFGDMSR